MLASIAAALGLGLPPEQGVPPAAAGAAAPVAFKGVEETERGTYLARPLLLLDGRGHPQQGAAEEKRWVLETSEEAEAAAALDLDIMWSSTCPVAACSSSSTLAPPGGLVSVGCPPNLHTPLS